MSLQFTLTPNLKKAVALINGIDGSKFPRVVLRIIQKLHLKDVKSFNEIEEQQLQEALGLTAENLVSVLETCSFILEQAAYHSAKLDLLNAQLHAIELEDDKIEAFLAVWKKEGPSLVSKLREVSLFPDKVASVHWSLHLQMAQSSAAKVKDPSAILELVVNHDTAPKKPDTRVHLEFSHDELYEFYNNLELIQEQLDQL